MPFRNPIKQIPNTLSLINLFLGSLATVSAFEGALVLSGYLILLAAVFDFLDGFAARLLKAYSPIGKELDSLSDLVSFGVAPSVILFSLLKGALGIASPEGFSTGNPILAIPFLVAVFSGLRLAIFNVDTRQSESFIGLPTPANALFVVGIAMGLQGNYAEWFKMVTGSSTVIIGMVIILSALLVSPLPMFSFKLKKGTPLSRMWKQLLLVLVSIVLFTFMGFSAFAIIIPFYILLSLIGVFVPKTTNA